MIDEGICQDVVVRRQLRKRQPLPLGRGGLLRRHFRAGVVRKEGLLSSVVPEQA
jgi:hypothetical protein